MIAAFLLEGLVALLLAVTIGYCVLLDRRLKALRSGQDGLKETIVSLNDAASRAEAAIEALKQASRDADHSLGDDVRQARALADELSLMISSGERIAERLSDRRGRVVDLDSAVEERLVQNLRASG